VIVYLNNRLVPHEEATVSVFDRGFLFGDGVYEGLRTSRGVVIGLDRHCARMRAGLDEARIRGFDTNRVGPLVDELLAATGLSDAFVYIQVTRGVPADPAARARVPKPGTPPTVFAYATPVTPVDQCRVPESRTAALRPDTRWTRGHLKSISLLGGVLAAIEASEAGADDAIMHRDGLVTEGTATNVFAAINGRIVTPALACAPMLAGVTRALLMDADPEIEERPVSVEELKRADEIMLVGTRTMVAWVSTLDGAPVGNGAARDPGPHAQRLLDLLRSAIERDVDEALHARAGSHARA